MKKFSLSSLSKQNLDKLQQSAIIGGDGSCICAYICTSCPCNNVGNPDLLASIDYAEMEVWAWHTADSIGG